MKIKHAIILILFAAGWTLTALCKVERNAQAKPVRLEAIPRVIGNWHMISENSRLGTKEEKFLDEVLVRTYRRNDGKIVMLAIAYGSDQRKKFTVHLPEVCYAASGCTVKAVGHERLDRPDVNVTQLVSRNPDGGAEAIQYWIVLAGKMVSSDLERQLTNAYLGFFGAQSAGVLVRTSSLITGSAIRQEYDIQNEFILALSRDVNSDHRRVLFGDGQKDALCGGTRINGE